MHHSSAHVDNAVHVQISVESRWEGIIPCGTGALAYAERRSWQMGISPMGNESAQETLKPTFSDISGGRAWSLVGLMTLAALINYLDRATLSVALPQIAAELSLGPAAKGVLLSAFFWSYALMQVPMGFLADRRDLRWLYAASFAVWSLACGSTGFAASFVMLIFLRIVLGVGESVLVPGSLRLISKLFAPRDRGLPSGLLDSGTRVGLALGASLVAWLTVRFGWRSMFFLIGFSALLWLVPWVVAFPRRLSGHNPHLPFSDTAIPAQRAPAAVFDRNLLGACLGFFCYGYYQYLLVTWLPDYLVQVRHFSILQAGFYSSLTYLVWAVSGPIGGLVVGRLFQHRVEERHLPERVKKV